MGKLLNPFFKIGRTVAKGAKYTGLAVAGAAGVLAFEMVPAYSDVITAALPSPFDLLVGLLLPSLLAGGATAARNFQKNYTVTPEQLAALLAADKAQKTAGRLSREELADLVKQAVAAAKK